MLLFCFKGHAQGFHRVFIGLYVGFKRFTLFFFVLQEMQNRFDFAPPFSEPVRLALGLVQILSVSCPRGLAFNLCLLDQELAISLYFSIERSRHTFSCVLFCWRTPFSLVFFFSNSSFSYENKTNSVPTISGYINTYKSAKSYRCDCSPRLFNFLQQAKYFRDSSIFLTSNRRRTTHKSVGPIIFAQPF